MKTINVVAAIIHRGEEILSTQRGDGEYEGWWEFPWFFARLFVFLRNGLSFLR